MASELYADDPAGRVAAAARLSPRQRKHLLRDAGDWPAYSPGSINAWLLLVTTKPPTWRDPIVDWIEAGPALGAAHEGFFYPDPLGFWAELRHWASVIVGVGLIDALTVTTVLHGSSLGWALDLMRPKVVLFLDEPASRAAPEVRLDLRPSPRNIPDPHRAGQYYEGWWSRAQRGGEELVVGKSPQHPVMHNLYLRADMDAYLVNRPGRAPSI